MTRSPAVGKAELYYAKSTKPDVVYLSELIRMGICMDIFSVYSARAAI